jgi:hypothetical protein
MRNSWTTHHPTSVIRRPLPEETVRELEKALGNHATEPPRPDRSEP